MSANVVALSTSNAGYSAAQVSLIKNTVARDTNADEFNLFVSVAHNTGLDPLRGQIMAIVYNKTNPEKRRMVIVTGIDGLRATAARSNRYRPDENEPEFTYDPDLKGADNPLGLVKVVVRIHIADVNRGDWRPVAGVAYWDEFAPMKEEVEGGFDWVDLPGQTWPNGDQKRKKVPRVEGAKTIRQLDTSGQWGKMGRLMLAKCAESQALRKAFPEDLSSLYEHSEMDQARMGDLLPSDLIEAAGVEDRMLRIGGPGGILFQFLPNQPLESVGLGQIADRIISASKDMVSTAQLAWFESVNAQSMREFWARAKTDALAVKRELEAKKAELLAIEAETADA
jgi:phage recombination protein Bet